MSNRPTMREAFEKWFARGTFESLGDDWGWAAFQAGSAWQAALAEPEAQMPLTAISTVLRDAMAAAVANGANSVSMPDEYVTVAAWLASADAARAAAPQDAVERFKAELLRSLEEPDAELLQEFQRAFVQQLHHRRHKPEAESAEMAGAREMFKLAMTRAKATAPQSVEPVASSEEDMKVYDAIAANYTAPPPTPTPAEWVEEAMRLADRYRGTWTGLNWQELRDALRAHLSTMPKEQRPPLLVTPEDYLELRDFARDIEIALEPHSSVGGHVERVKALVHESLGAWIACSERLPEPYQVVLVFAGSVTQARRIVRPPQHEGGIAWRAFPEMPCDGYLEVTHWRPLPEPPKGGE